MSTSVKLDEDLKSRIQYLATLCQRSPHWLIREAIEQYVAREEKREALRQDAINAWNEYQETGLRLTGDEVIEWLDTWSEEKEYREFVIEYGDSGYVALYRYDKDSDVVLALRHHKEAGY